MVREYMVKVYAFLIKETDRDISTLPSIYQIPVAKFMAKEEEEKLNA